MIDADGTRTRERFEPAEDPPVDCFYVYPTVSEGTSDNAPLEVTDAEVRTVRAQAARFAASCRLFAPIYRQITRRGLVSGALSRPAARERAYRDVLSAFNDYLNTENRGRPFVLIGHSQGATVLTALIQRQVDGNPRLRSQLLSALLLGGPVTVAPGSDAGGSFVTIPACRSAQETGCVVAYATYAGTPPTNGLFGRSTADRQALCVSPGALLGRGEQLRPYFPTPDLVDESGAAGRRTGAGVHRPTGGGDRDVPHDRRLQLARRRHRAQPGRVPRRRAGGYAAQPGLGAAHRRREPHPRGPRGSGGRARAGVREVTGAGGRR